MERMVFDVPDSDTETMELGNVDLLIEVSEPVEAGILGRRYVGDAFTSVLSGFLSQAVA